MQFKLSISGYSVLITQNGERTFDIVMNDDVSIYSGTTEFPFVPEHTCTYIERFLNLSNITLDLVNGSYMLCFSDLLTEKKDIVELELRCDLPEFEDARVRQTLQLYKNQLTQLHRQVHSLEERLSRVHDLPDQIGYIEYVNAKLEVNGFDQEFLEEWYMHLYSAEYYGKPLVQHCIDNPQLPIKERIEHILYSLLTTKTSYFSGNTKDRSYVFREVISNIPTTYSRVNSLYYKGIEMSSHLPFTCENIMRHFNTNISSFVLATIRYRKIQRSKTYPNMIEALSHLKDVSNQYTARLCKTEDRSGYYIAY